MRIAIAAVAAGLALFVWGAVAHMALPLGTMGLSAIPRVREEMVLATLKSSIPEPGLYIYPWLEPAQRANDRAMQAWEARVRSGPAGLLLIHPAGERFLMQPLKLGLELAGSVACALLVALLVSRVRGPWLARGLVGLAFALFGWLSLQLPLWNFYGFPAGFSVASLIEETVGGLLVGLIAAGIVPGPPR